MAKAEIILAGLIGLIGLTGGLLLRSVRPSKRVDVWPVNHVMFSRDLSDEDRLGLLDQAAPAVREGRLSASSIKSDEVSRAEFYGQSLKSGLVPHESHSTSSRNSRGQQ